MIGMKAINEMYCQYTEKHSTKKFKQRQTCFSFHELRSTDQQSENSFISAETINELFHSGKFQMSSSITFARK